LLAAVTRHTVFPKSSAKQAARAIDSQTNRASPRCSLSEMRRGRSLNGFVKPRWRWVDPISKKIHLSPCEGLA
jgi:hypothetical protein